MKVRLKFRNNFHSVTVESTSTLSDVLSVASEVFKIGISNVQLSLNAKDYFSLDDCNRTLSELGIVSGDILYVNSLEVLDDIKKCVEKELLSNITNLLQTIPIPHQTVCHWVSIALIVILEDKDFHASG
ncbi:hypothetical protein FGIG_04740 [Fasciola gigantica]|uniref:Ubiquitin-like domain-containing protein n=1 Tax=Fasciola gigantica TaxID=46835 RepID=A0A504YLY9_FASGI|nr:hypothetical protein FGIG_04740 [Fasciola gigantica]